MYHFILTSGGLLVRLKAGPHVTELKLPAISTGPTKKQTPVRYLSLQYSHCLDNAALFYKLILSFF